MRDSQWRVAGPRGSVLTQRAEPADDPTRPASVGRPAYDEDRAAALGFDKPRRASAPPPPNEGRKYGDDGVSGGIYGYGKTVDTAFKYLASEGTFLLGAVSPLAA